MKALKWLLIAVAVMALATSIRIAWITDGGNTYRYPRVATPSNGFDAVWRQTPIGYIFRSGTGDLDPWAIEDGFDTLSYVRSRYGDSFEAEYGERFIAVFNKAYADALHDEIIVDIADRATLAPAAGGLTIFLLLLVPVGALLWGGSLIWHHRRRVVATADNAAVGAAAATIRASRSVGSSWRRFVSRATERAG